MMIYLLLFAQTISTLVGGNYIRAKKGDVNVYVVSQRGITVLNTSDLEEIFMEYEIPTPGTSIDVAITDDNIYILDSQEGILIYSKEDKKLKNKTKIGKITTLLSIPPYVYAGDAEGKIYIFEEKGDKLKKRGEIELKDKIPVTELRITLKGFFVLQADSILSHTVFEKEGKIKLLNRYIFNSLITRFVNVDSLVIYGKKDGGLYLGILSEPVITEIKTILDRNYIVTSLYLFGAYLYVGTEDGRVVILDYKNFEKVSETHLVGEVNDFVPIGNILIALLGRAGIFILEVPTLKEIRTIGGIGSVNAVEIINPEVLFVLDPLLGIRFISFFSPYNPLKEYTVNLPGDFVKVKIFKHFLLGGIKQGGVWIINYTEKFNPLGFIPFDGILKNIIVIEDRFFIITDKSIIGYIYDDKDFVKIFDIDIDSRIFSAFYVTEDKFCVTSEKGTFIYNKDGKVIEHKAGFSFILYEKRGDYFYLLDVLGNLYRFTKTLQNLEKLGFLHSPVTDFSFGKKYIYILDGTSEVYVYTLSDMEYSFSISVPSPVFNIDVKYPYVFLYGFGDIVYVYDVSLEVPSLVNSIRGEKKIRSLNFFENGIFMGGEGIIEIYRFFRFEYPAELSFYLIPGELYKAITIGKKKDIMYVAAGSIGILGIDLSNIYSPKKFFNFKPDIGATFDILKVGRYIVTANLEGGIYIFELINERKPRYFYHIEGDCISIATIGTSFLISGGRKGDIRVYDIRSPAFSEIYSSSVFKNPILDIEVFKSTVYFALGDEGLIRMDFSVPHSPQVKKKYTFPFPVYRLKIIDNKLFAICGSYGIVVYEIKKNGDLKRLDKIDTPGNAQDITKLYDYYLISDMYSLEVYKD